MRLLATSLLATAICLSALAAQTIAPNELEQQLRQRWVGKAMLLCGFPIEDHITTDAGGHSIKPIQSGPWTLGAIKVTGVMAIEPEAKLRAIRKAAAHAFPKGEIEQVLA